MKKKLYMPILAAVLLSGCLTSEKNSPVVTYKNTEINGKTVSSGIISPSNIAQFSDIPIPEGAVMNTDGSVIMGTGDEWTGRLIYSAPYAANAVFEFYLSEMPKFGWSDVATVRARISHLTYIKDRKAIQILIEKNSDSESYITVTSIPNNTGISGQK